MSKDVEENHGNSQQKQEEQPKLWATDSLTTMETNIDDMTGEHLAFVIELLLSNGAADAWVTPIVMKKGRPAHTLHCVFNNEEDREALDSKTQDRLLELIFRHTTTLGVRIIPDMSRAKLPRSFVTVPTRYHEAKTVDVKVGRFVTGEVVSRKAEFDHCREIALEVGVPIADVADAAVREAKEREV